MMANDFFLNNRNKLAAFGLILVFPAFFIVSFGLMNASGFPAPNDWLTELIRTNAAAKWALDTFLQPVVVLGGLFIALAGNLFTLLRIQIERQEFSMLATITLKDRARNAAMVGFSTFLSCAIMAYAFFENFQIVPR
ncbi:MAG: hypothetical protein HYY49_04785 [Ignavibacteriales bacterium]|nr:hypothetical protein [Ignavibacteriales bacterium]